MHKATDVIETIQAAHNLTIEHSPTHWRLVNGAPSGEPLALLQVDEQGIHCAPAFAAARHLPNGGLSRTDVARVVVGWAPEAAAWHLGLLLANAAGEDHRLRWCGLASWPQGSPDDHGAEAQAAGQSLARALDLPLHLIPPPGEPAPAAADTQAVQSTAPIAAVQMPVVELLTPDAPPFEFDEIEFVATPNGYVWRRRMRWVLMAIVRGVGMLVLAALFLLMGIGTQTSGLAPVNPPWLPWLGMAVAGLLLVLALRSFWAVLTVSDVIVDRQASEVRRQARLFGGVHWRVPFASAAYVVVSQPPARPQGRRRGGPMRTVQDVWLHLSDGARFWPVAEIERVVGYSHGWERTRTRQNTKGRRRLEASNYDTPAHHAARVMADAIGCDLWLDIR